jgi:hypothetical protein
MFLRKRKTSLSDLKKKSRRGTSLLAFSAYNSQKTLFSDLRSFGHF